MHECIGKRGRQLGEKVLYDFVGAIGTGIEREGCERSERAIAGLVGTDSRVACGESVVSQWCQYYQQPTLNCASVSDCDSVP